MVWSLRKVKNFVIKLLVDFQRIYYLQIEFYEMNLWKENYEPFLDMSNPKKVKK